MEGGEFFSNDASGPFGNGCSSTQAPTTAAPTTAAPTTATPTTAAPTPYPTIRCKDRKDKFELNGTTRKWCLWLGNKFPDPADQLKQCIRKNLTDDCPEVCQKSECFPTDSP